MKLTLFTEFPSMGLFPPHIHKNNFIASLFFFIETHLINLKWFKVQTSHLRSPPAPLSYILCGRRDYLIKYHLAEHKPIISITIIAMASLNTIPDTY